MTPIAPARRPTSRIRDTLWFKKGELDAEQALQAAGSSDDLEPNAVDILPIEDRYLDDGSLRPEDSQRYGVHTGRTETIPEMRPAPVASDFDVADELRSRGLAYLALAVGGLGMVGAGLGVVCAIAVTFLL